MTEVPIVNPMHGSPPSDPPQVDVRPISGRHPDPARLATAAYEAMLRHFEYVEDCTCADDEWDTCWYRYTSDEKRQARIDAIAAAIESQLDGTADQPNRDELLRRAATDMAAGNPLLHQALAEDEQLYGTADQPTTGEHHVMVDTPSWDTKVRCSCGEDFTSRAEFYKHGYEALSAQLDVSAVSGLADALGASTVIPPEDMPRALYEARQEVERLRAEHEKAINEVISWKRNAKHAAETKVRDGLEWRAQLDSLREQLAAANDQIAALRRRLAASLEPPGYVDATKFPIYFECPDCGRGLDEQRCSTCGWEAPRGDADPPAG